MLLNPLTTRDAFEIDEAEEVAKSWWLFLFSGLVSAAKTPEERAHYDWMGYVGNFIAISTFIVLPFAGYWLGREIYAFNQRAITHAERSGFVREGVKRKAYWRHGEWVDGVMFGLVREDLE